VKGDFFIMKKLLSLFTLFLFMACNSENIETPDGKVPSAYINEALQYTGAFRGDFNGIDSKINLSITDHNLVKLSAKALGFRDVLDIFYAGDRNCYSQVGNLKSIRVNKKTRQLETAEFHFESSCRSGNSFFLDFNSENSFHSQLYIDSRRVE